MYLEDNVLEYAISSNNDIEAKQNSMVSTIINKDKWSCKPQFQPLIQIWQELQ